VGRPRSFDEEKALEAAADCFWPRGYEATPVRDLTRSMGIAGPSLYNAYGGKRGLFAAALGHYFNRTSRERIARLEASLSGAGAIESFFREAIEKSLCDSGRKGCFLVNAALEMAPRDPALAEEIEGYFSEIRDFFARHVARAQADGELAGPCDPNLYAVHLLCVLMGIRVMARCCPDRSFLEAAAGPALGRLRLSTSTRKDPA
jgi:TetR/AcrR family transcriptional regulator, transcriptional repressor for nem operon